MSDGEEMPAMPTPPDAPYTRPPAAGAQGRGLRSSGEAAIRPHLPVTCTSPICLQAPQAPSLTFLPLATRWEYFQAVVMSKRGKASGSVKKTRAVQGNEQPEDLIPVSFLAF